MDQKVNTSNQKKFNFLAIELTLVDLNFYDIRFLFVFQCLIFPFFSYFIILFLIIDKNLEKVLP